MIDGIKFGGQRGREIIYSVKATDRDLDSWDIENLKYIRKISIQTNPANNNVSPTNETLSYVSSNDDDDNGITFNQQTPTKQSSYFEHESKVRVLPEETSNFIIVEDSKKKKKNDPIPFPPLRKCSGVDPTEYSSCYLMDVLLVANESVQQHHPQPQKRAQNTYTSSPLLDVGGRKGGQHSRSQSISSSSSIDSFASAIQKGFFDMDSNHHHHHNGQHLKLYETNPNSGHPTERKEIHDFNHTLKDNLDKQCKQRSRVKKSVSFLDESFIKENELKRQEHTKKVDGRMMRRGGSFNGAQTQQPSGVDETRFKGGQKNIPSVPWNGKLIESQALEVGYAHNWAHLESYVNRLHSQGKHSNSL